MISFREELYDYVKKKYKREPEYLWHRYPGYAIFRHQDNEKWFGLIMDVPADRLGLPGDEVIDILNVKLNDAFLADCLVQQEGFLRGYHISRGNWVSILLDGTVPYDEVCRWLDDSYLNTASKEERLKMRPPKDWIVPANPKYYDVQEAFRREKEIDWKQGKGIRTGDTVFLYVAAPVSAILYKCKVTQTDIPYRFGDGALQIRSLMKLRLQKQYKPDRLTFERLGREFGIHAVRGPRGIPEDLSEALRK